MSTFKFKRKISDLDKLYLFISSIMTTFLGLVLPFSILIIFDRILPNQSKDSLMLLGLIILIAIYFDYILKRKEEAITSLIMKKFDKDLTSNVFKNICNSDIATYSKHSPGEYLERISVIPELKSFFGGESVKAIINTITSFITILIIGLINVWSGTIIIISSTILIFTAIIISNKKINVLVKRSDIEGRTSSKIIEIVSSPLDIKSRTMEYRVESLMTEMIREREEHSVAFEKLDSILNLILTFIQQLSIATVVVMLALSVIAQEIGQGVMAAVILLTNRYFSPYQQVMQTLSRWKVNQLNEQRMNTLFQLNHNIDSDIKDFSINTILCEINNNEEICFKKGQVYVVNGKANAGKSYLSRCLTMEEKSTSINIIIGEHSLGEIDYNTWKQHALKIDNNSALIEGNIIDNLTCFRSYLNETAFTLCENLNIKNEINALKSGFYTQISSNQQPPFSRKVNYCLLIVRAILSNKSVIILDDIDTIYDEHFEKVLTSTSLSKKDNIIFIFISNKIKNKDNNIRYLNIKKGY
ncbi:ABC transporter transmembrane domain-containing protein [uncultured Shewanella sp.]|uniref:ABC transporter transmembrane domain-containing protein n=1 Tax=uncultured Shewanella sp. TaxID=173975 RepID=UPI00263322B5|nr:ABC transporter transmembrane domain-containing protein [uncultured Shewanella sp.]